MKKTIVMAAIAAFALISCGTSRTVTYVPVTSTPSAPSTPTHTSAPATEPKAQKPVQQVTSTALDEAELALLQESTNLRALGTARSYDISNAIALATDAAVDNLVVRVRTAAVRAAETYLKQTQANASIDEEKITEAISQRISKDIIGGLKPIAISKQAFNDGTFLYKICFEMTKTRAQLEEEVAAAVAAEVADNIPAETEEDIEANKENFKKNKSSMLAF